MWFRSVEGKGQITSRHGIDPILLYYSSWWPSDGMIQVSNRLHIGKSLEYSSSTLQVLVLYISMVSCQKGPTSHAYAWQIGPFRQDTFDMQGSDLLITAGVSSKHCDDYKNGYAFLLFFWLLMFVVRLWSDDGTWMLMTCLYKSDTRVWQVLICLLFTIYVTRMVMKGDEISKCS